MRKAAAVILSLFYLLLATEASVAIHKCMGAVKTIDIGQIEKECCCGDMETSGCCENETVDLPQDREDKLISTYTFSFSNDFFQVIELPSLIMLEANNSGEIEFGEGVAPPLLTVPSYIKHCSFTFYG
ncbi:MAG: hypothetical protein ABJF04_17905 [Reichenbachiella sp.]|uniref:HYC_CC_PP family protein n=1 Tax=Reichenbachiella sp. TaxID=2184521 RepID=UPI0032654B1E